MDRKNKFYLAAPFFNPAQLTLVTFVERVFDEAGVDYFSPRLLDENKQGPIDARAAASIFRKDINGMMLCDSVLALVDWKLPEGQKIRLGHQRDDSFQPIVEVPPLNLPDSGTVFEMGFAYCRTWLAQAYRQTEAFDPVGACKAAIAQLPGGRVRADLMDLAQMLEIIRGALRPMRTVVYTDRPPEAGLNLMLTQGASGVVNGLQQLRDFLGKTGNPDWDSLKPWTGKNR